MADKNVEDIIIEGINLENNLPFFQMVPYHIAENCTALKVGRHYLLLSKRKDDDGNWQRTKMTREHTYEIFVEELHLRAISFLTKTRFFIDMSSERDLNHISRNELYLDFLTSQDMFKPYSCDKEV